MKVSVTGRHMEITDALKSHVESGLDKVRSHFDKVIDATVVLAVEKHRHIAEINLLANGMRIHSKETSDDMYASMDAAFTKLEKQIKKHKDRINRHQPRTSRESRSYHHQIISLDSTNGHAETDVHEIVHREKVPMKPLSVEEAVMQLELVDEPFVVFSNADTSQVNVLYARDNGTYGLIEPQF